MAGIGLSIALLGGLIALVSGASRGDWVAGGFGLALMGIGLLLWELITTIVKARSSDRPT